VRVPASYVEPFHPRGEVSGRVVLAATVTEDGSVRDVVVHEEMKARGEFTVAAREAVALWRYIPSNSDGWNVPSRIKIVVNFEDPSARGKAGRRRPPW
jgi:TonB family protein